MVPSSIADQIYRNSQYQRSYLLEKERLRYTDVNLFRSQIHRPKHSRNYSSGIGQAFWSQAGFYYTPKNSRQTALNNGQSKWYWALKEDIQKQKIQEELLYQRKKMERDFLTSEPVPSKYFSNKEILSGMQKKTLTSKNAMKKPKKSSHFDFSEISQRQTTKNGRGILEDDEWLEKEISKIKQFDSLKDSSSFTKEGSKINKRISLKSDNPQQNVKTLLQQKKEINSIMTQVKSSLQKTDDCSTEGQKSRGKQMLNHIKIQNKIQPQASNYQRPLNNLSGKNEIDSRIKTDSQWFYLKKNHFYENENQGNSREKDLNQEVQSAGSVKDKPVDTHLKKPKLKSTQHLSLNTAFYSDCDQKKVEAEGDSQMKNEKFVSLQDSPLEGQKQQIHQHLDDLEECQSDFEEESKVIEITPVKKTPASKKKSRYLYLNDEHQSFLSELRSGSASRSYHEQSGFEISPSIDHGRRRSSAESSQKIQDSIKQKILSNNSEIQSFEHSQTREQGLNSYSAIYDPIGLSRKKKGSTELKNAQSNQSCQAQNHSNDKKRGLIIVDEIQQQKLSSCFVSENPTNESENYNPSTLESDLFKRSYQVSGQNEHHFQKKKNTTDVGVCTPIHRVEYADAGVSSNLENSFEDKQKQFGIINAVVSEQVTSTYDSDRLNEAAKLKQKLRVQEEVIDNFFEQIISYQELTEKQTRQIEDLKDQLQKGEQSRQKTN